MRDASAKGNLVFRKQKVGHYMYSRFGTPVLNLGYDTRYANGENFF